MRFKYTYKITYSSGRSRDGAKQVLTVEITQEQYNKIMEKVTQGYAISEILEMDNLIQEMKEQVRLLDRCENLDGSHRKIPLKKERNIAEIELLLPEEDVRKICKRKKSIETLNTTSEKMTIYRNDGSSVILRMEQGRVKIKDSRKNGMEMCMETDPFLDLIVSW